MECFFGRQGLASKAALLSAMPLREGWKNLENDQVITVRTLSSTPLPFPPRAQHSKNQQVDHGHDS